MTNKEKIEGLKALGFTVEDLGSIARVGCGRVMATPFILKDLEVKDIVKYMIEGAFNQGKVCGKKDLQLSYKRLMDL